MEVSLEGGGGQESKARLFKSMLTLKNVFVIFTTASWVPNKSLCLACVPPYSIMLYINWNEIIMENKIKIEDCYASKSDFHCKI